MQPEIHIGPLTLQTFGICFALAFLAAGFVVAKRLREWDKPTDWAYEMVFCGLIGGIVGARIDYALQHWDDVSDDLIGNLFSGSGLVWFGGASAARSASCSGPATAGCSTSPCSTSPRCRSRSAMRSGALAVSSRATATTASNGTGPGRCPIPTGRSRPRPRSTRPRSTRRSRWALSRTCSGGCATVPPRDPVRALSGARGGRAPPRRVHPPQRRCRARAHPAPADQRRDDRRGRDLDRGRRPQRRARPHRPAT